MTASSRVPAAGKQAKPLQARVAGREFSRETVLIVAHDIDGLVPKPLVNR
jgi:hypothetical protein